VGHKVFTDSDTGIVFLGLHGWPMQAQLHRGSQRRPAEGGLG
jgi:hypothetical protein